MIEGERKDKIHNCWEFINCPINKRIKCEVYQKKLGDVCWFVVEDSGKICFDNKENKNCNTCEWFEIQNN